MTATTPGQAAFAAYYASIAGLLVMPDSWDMQSSAIREAWDDAATAAVAATLPPLPEKWAEPQAAPELAAAMAETRQLRELVMEILGEFTVTDSGCRARAGSMQIRKWRDRAGLNASAPDGMPEGAAMETAP